MSDIFYPSALSLVPFQYTIARYYENNPDITEYTWTFVRGTRSKHTVLTEKFEYRKNGNVTGNLYFKEHYAIGEKI